MPRLGSNRKPERPIWRVLAVAALLGVTAGASLATSSHGDGDSTAAGFGMLPSFEAVGDNLIRLQSAAFDPLVGLPPVVPEIPSLDETALAGDVATYWLVQVTDDRFADVAAAIDALGAQRIGNIPDGVYMVRATPLQRAALAANPAVRWSGVYQPSWRVPVALNGLPGLLDLEGEQTYRVHVFRTHPDPDAVGRTIAAIPGAQVVDDARFVIDVTATRAQVPAFAAIDGVEWVTLKPTGVLLNDDARWVIDTGVRDLLAATAPGRLTGAGQTAAVADSGLNYKPDLNGRAHVAFRDCDTAGVVCQEADYTQVTPGTGTAELVDVVANNPGDPHRMMAAFFDLGDVGPNPPDDSSHGTHTGGSVTGDAGVPGVADGHDGLAPGARLVYQSIADIDGGLNTPTDYYQLFRQAYRPSNPGAVPEAYDPTDYANYNPFEDARTHNNSYGLTIPVADPFAESIAIDRFVWEHEDMNIVVSAGNSGPAVGTIGAPSVSKNGFSSAASSNGRQPMVAIDSLTNFSSHGPTGDGRLGPTVATPGEIVVSPKGGTVDGYQYLQGTSMSGPILTGALTLVRQYFYDGYGPAGGVGFPTGVANAAASHNPSAALVKAAVVTGAVRMRGWHTGDDGTVPDLDGQWPSMGQGFGLMNLDASLYFAGDPVHAWYHDVYRADADAFPIGLLGTRSYQLDVAAGAPLDVTLAWTDAPDLLPAGSPNLVNNLNLCVLGPNGETYIGNNMNTRLDPGAEVGETPDSAVAAPDLLNNTERVSVADPAPGTYTVTVSAPVVADGPQGFALAASGLLSEPDSNSTFSPGPARQADAPGAPVISDVQVEPVSADLARVTFTTSEPTEASVTVSGIDHTYDDVYQITPDGYFGIATSPVEDSPTYAGRRVLGTRHEVLVTGLTAGTAYSVTATATDLASQTVSAAGGSFTSPATVFQPGAPDMAQLTSDGAGPQWGIGKQMYAGWSDAFFLGAFMFRLPASVDPAAVTGAYVEFVTAHNVSSQYTADPVFDVELLDEAVEPGWGAQTFQEIADAASLAQLNPTTTVRQGANERVAYTFSCDEIEALRATLATEAGGERMAAFRYESTDPGEHSLVSMEVGFNRRSGGPQLRPKLVLLTAATQSVPPFMPCDPATPAPTITDVGIHRGSDNGTMTVSWRTDVDSSSVVLYRERGTTDWIQVGTPARTLMHQVEVGGLDPTKRYEFGVRSVGCNGATTTADNGGAGWDFFRDIGTTLASIVYDYEADAQGWTTASEDVGGTLPTTPTQWERRSPGDASQQAWYAMPYGDHTNADLISPLVALPGSLVTVDFHAAYDFEQASAVFTTTDGLYLDYSIDGTTWVNAALFQGQNAGYPAMDPERVTFASPGSPLQVRFRAASDDNISSPQYAGVVVDTVTLSSSTAAVPADEALTGPVVPPTAGASGLRLADVPPATAPTPAEVAAGTGMCTQVAGAAVVPPAPLPGLPATGSDDVVLPAMAFALLATFGRRLLRRR